MSSYSNSNSNSAYSSRNRIRNNEQINQRQSTTPTQYFQTGTGSGSGSGSGGRPTTTVGTTAGNIIPSSSSFSSSMMGNISIASSHSLPKPTSSQTLKPYVSSSSSLHSGSSHSNRDRDRERERDTRGVGRDSRGYSHTGRDGYDRDRDRDTRGSRDYRDRDSREHRPYRDSRDSRDHYNTGRRDYRDDRRNEYRRDGYRSGDRRNDYRYGSSYNSNNNNRREYRPNDSRSNSSRDGGSNNKDYDDLRGVDLTNITPLDKLSREDSKWDIKPAGFTNVTSEKAKISGFFPLPGEKRKVDISKLEGLVSNGDLASTSILFDTVDIEPFSSHMAKILRITDIEFTLFPVERLIDAIKTFIGLLRSSSGFIVRYDLKMLPVSNKQYLIVEFSDVRITTDVFCAVGYFQELLNLRDMSIERPDGYVSYEREDDADTTRDSSVTANTAASSTDTDAAGPERIEEDEEEDDEEEEEFPDSSKKLAVQNIPDSATPEELKELLSSKVGPICRLKPLLNKANKIQNIAYVEFANLTTGQAIVKICQLTLNGSQLSAIEASNSSMIQTSKLTYRNLQQISQLGDTRISRVLILLNLIRPEHLKSKSTIEELHEDIQFKLSQFGTIEKIHIPTPQTSQFKKSIKTIDSNVGKVYVKFKDLESAKVARDEMRGMRYNGRTVVCSFWEVLDFDLGIF